MERLNFTKRINIFCGHYGSGKSEISVNAAAAVRKEHEHVILADMDIVNPYFRSADAKNKLESMNIKVLAPVYANTNVDVPVIGPEIEASLRNKDCNSILDVGGDEDGARILGRFHMDISKNDYELFFVLNRARPMTLNFDETLNYIGEIEAASRLKITKLISNTHYLEETTVDDVLYGLELAREVSEKTGIKLAAVSVMGGLERQLENKVDVPVFILKKNMILPF